MAPRYGDRQGGYLRIVKTGFQKGDGAEKAFIELLGAEKQLDEKRQKRAEIKAKKRAELEEAGESRRAKKRAAKKQPSFSRSIFLSIWINGASSFVGDAPFFFEVFCTQG